MSSASAAHLQALAGVELPAGLDRVKLSAWLISCDEAEAAKARELELRKEVLAQAGFDAAAAGTKTLPLGAGYVLASVTRLYHKLDGPKTRVALDVIRAAGPVGVLIADRLVKWSAELSLSEYKKLGAKQKRAIDKALTITPGQASLELRTPKPEA